MNGVDIGASPPPEVPQSAVRKLLLQLIQNHRKLA
jgi:hypothetical protein